MGASRQPVKFSGLVAAGRITPKQDENPPQFGNALSNETLSNDALIDMSNAVDVDIDRLDDSPFQFRRKYDPIRIDQLSASLEEAGQRSPITVRVVTSGRYEIIKGHTRKYAAKNIDWTKLKALVVERSDREAKLDLMLDNEGDKLEEYEYALMYKSAMGDGYATNQTQVARLFRCSQSKVSNCLSMLELPEPVLSLLNNEPALIGSKAAKVVAALWTEHPTHHDLILEALERVKQGAEQATIKGWVAQKLTSLKQDAPKKLVRHFITAPTGDARYVTVAKDRDIVVRLTDAALDRDMVHRRIDELLRQLESENEK